MKSQLTGKDPVAGKDQRKEEKEMTEDKKVGWHHRLSEFEQAPAVGDGLGSLVCCNPWGPKELDMTEQLNNKRYKAFVMFGTLGISYYQ